MTNDTETKKQPASLLVATARAIGGAAGRVASTVGVHPPGTTAPSSAPLKHGKFPKRMKSRLPRRQKKELRKKQAAAAM
jgi:hypothetical protein